MRKSETERKIGKIRRKNALFPGASYPIRRVQKIEIMIKSIHASIGIRFLQAASVYPWEFNTSFMPPRTKVAIGDGNRSDSCGGRGPQFSLQLSSPGIDLQKLVLIPSLVIENTLVEVASQQCVHFHRIGGGQLAYPKVFGTDCVGFLFFVVLTLIVPADSHRKGEGNDKAHQRQGCCKDESEIIAHFFAHASAPRTAQGADPPGEPECRE
jgi:hypothetical protein